jgi:DNA-binding NarL/FixJ family response regulator
MGDNPNDNDRLNRFFARHREMVGKANALADAPRREPIIPDVMTPDHPLAKAFGFDQAVAMFDTPARKRAILAKQRRDDVARLSRQGKLVREIAAELGLSYNYVVELRMALGVTRLR